MPLLSKRFNQDAFIKGAYNPRKWFSINNKADIPEIFIYDQIGYDFWGDGLTAKDFIAEFNKIKAKEVNVRINSPGGDVWDGKAIYNTLKDSGKTINITIDGIAASAASFIAMAASPGRLKVYKSSEMMIHEAWSMSVGNASDMRKQADLLDRTTESLSSIYADRVNLLESKILSMMVEETWMFGKEIVDKGFADEIIDQKSKTKNNIFDKAFFNDIGDVQNFSNLVISLNKRSLEGFERDADPAGDQTKKNVVHKRSAFHSILDSINERN